MRRRPETGRGDAAALWEGQFIPSPTEGVFGEGRRGGVGSITRGAVSQRLKHARWRAHQELAGAIKELLAAAGEGAIAPFDIRLETDKS